jgi:predicted TPR repeat methyltransferase
VAGVTSFFYKRLCLTVRCSGLSGEVITEAGLSWMGLDISPAMLAIAAQVLLLLLLLLLVD